MSLRTDYDPQIMPIPNEPSELSPGAAWFEFFNSRQSTRPVRILFWTLTAVAGFVQAWSLRFYINPDGNNYLDVASAYLRGDYVHAINGHWSPMFSWLIALVLLIFKPSPYSETTVLHLLNLTGLLVALRCFEFFFVAFLKFLQRSKQPNDESLLSEPAWWLLGYGLFLSTGLFVLSLAPVTPDIWVCVLSYLAVGILLRIALFPQRSVYFLILGVVLGLAYLTKSFYFPLSLVFLCAAWLASGTPRRNFARFALAFAVFALVSGPFVFALSKAKHRLTFGDAGHITYATWVSPIEQSVFWQGENQTGTPMHPVRKILSSPRVYEFATPGGESYPPTYDLSYWMEGVKPHFNLRGQLRIFRQSVGSFFLIFVIQMEFAVGLIAFLICGQQWCGYRRALTRFWLLWLPPALGCLAYSFVLVEFRYVAPFVIFLWLAAFAAALSVPSLVSSRVSIALVLAVLSVTAIKTAKYFVSDLAATAHQENIDWKVAQSLRAIGLKPGDRVAVIAGRAEGHWARLSGVQIVAEVPLGDDTLFWASDRPKQNEVFAKFVTTGSRAVVAKDPPPGEARYGWVQLGDTTYYAYLLPPNP